jgi:hypothetical protein
MSLCTLLDLVWAEIYDDVGPMGDQTQYREIVTKIYIDGQDPRTITYKDAHGKTKRLSMSGGRGGSVSSGQLDQIRMLQEHARRLAEAQKLASPPDG